MFQNDWKGGGFSALVYEEFTTGKRDTEDTDNVPLMVNEKPTRSTSMETGRPLINGLYRRGGPLRASEAHSWGGALGQDGRGAGTACPKKQSERRFSASINKSGERIK